jgi:hypothetical protein
MKTSAASARGIQVLMAAMAMGKSGRGGMPEKPIR